VAAFVDKYGQMAYDSAVHTGVPYEVTLAQAILESGYGNSTLASQYNNFFGIKPGSNWTGAVTPPMPTSEYENGVYVKIMAPFRAYASPEDSFTDHANFLRVNSRYANAFQYSNDPMQFAATIAADGYATDPNYTSKLQSLIGGIQEYVASKNLWPPSSSVTYDIAPPTSSDSGSSATSTASGSCGTPAGTTIDTSTIFQDSSNVPCASGTRDVGIQTGYHAGQPIQIRLCALPNLPSTGQESNSGNSYYVQGANGDAIVNAMVYGAFEALVTAAQNAVIPMHANSTFRTMAHQQDLCNGNSACSSGNYTTVAMPGTSNHQMGLAIDFTMANSSKFPDSSASCQTVSNRCEAPGDTVWEWLNSNAANYGILPYVNEYWHWSPTGN
jgi:hypothetical protein